jgi:hypothetical protein
MQGEVSHRTRRVKREPVYQGTKRVPGLWVRESASGNEALR